MTPAEINAILAKADGYVDHGPINSGHPPGSEIPVCLTCNQVILIRRGETKSRASCPRDYTTSYPDLARVEAKVYGPGASLRLGLHEDTPGAKCWAENVEYPDLDGWGSTELHARAECLARVIQEQEKQNVTD